MKILKLYIVLAIFFSFNFLYSQTNNVGIGILTPDNSAKLELFSTTQGFLAPQLTLAQRNAIVGPATGLLIHQTTNSPGYYYWDGVQWRKWAVMNVEFLVYGDGTLGQVAVWSTSNTITGTNDLFYDFTNTRLGVGTNTPSEALDVAGAIRIGNTATNNEGAMKFVGGDFWGYDGTNWYSFTSNTLTGSGLPGQVTYWSSPTTVAGSNDLFVDVTTFSLGIRTTTPGEKLDVNGALAVGSTTVTIPGNIRWTGSDFEGWNGTRWMSFTSGTLSGEGADGQVTYWESSTFLAGSNNLFYNYTDTRLGIGTSTPNEALEVDGAITLGTNTQVVPIDGTMRWSGSDFEGWDGTQWISFTQSGPFGSGNPTQVAFWLTSRTLTGDDNLYWDNVNKRVGVGTTIPSYELDVAGSIRSGGDGAHGYLRFYSEQGATDRQLAFTANSSSTASMTFTMPSDDGDNYFFLASDGNGELFWGSPFLMLGYYWALDAPLQVLATIGDWGISRYGNTLSGTTTKQINFGFLSTTGSAYSTIHGGYNNTASATFSTITGGQGNTASGAYSMVLGGINNTASGAYSNVFGNANNVSGNYSTISNGQNLSLSGSGSYAFRGAFSVASASLTSNNTFNVLDSKFYFNKNQGDYDFRLDGDNNDNVFFADASSNRVGLNTTAPSKKLEIKNGKVRMSNSNNTATKLKLYEAQGSSDNYSSFSATSQTANMLYQLPVWHNIRHSGLINDGTGNLRWASPTELTQILTHAITTLTDASTPYTPSKRDINIYVNGSGGTNIVINLLPAASVKGKEYYIKKNTTTGYTITIDPSGAETIDGAATFLFASGEKYSSLFIVSNGFNWFIMANFDGNP